MPRPTIGPLTLTSVSLSIYSGDKLLSQATGFVAGTPQQRYLVSNWHVFAGKDQITGEYLGSFGNIPSHVQVTGFDFEGDSVVSVIQRLPLYEPSIAGESTASILWRQHDSYGSDVDVAVLPLPNEFVHRPDPLDLYKPDYAVDPTLAFAISVPDPVVILGYPLGLDGGVPFAAIWMQGHIASEYDLNHGGLPRFLVDVRSREGMSGSPVYFYPRGRPAKFADGAKSVLVDDANKIVGVYSGRADPESDLGFVWRIQLVEEIIQAGVEGVPFK